MRVVERTVETRSARYLIARTVGFCAGAVALLLCVLILINNSRLRSADPMNNKLLDSMKAELTPATDDPALIEQIRELDRLSRRAYFTAEDFNHKGIIFMVLCLVVMVGSLKYAGSLAKEDPYPDPSTPKRDLVKEANFARSTFVYGALVLLGFMLVTALLWESPLDEEAQAAELEGGAAEPEPAAPLPLLAQPEPAQLLRNWPSFLGAGGSRVEGASPPLDWAAEGAIAWKSEVPLPGFSSPILWEGQLFLSGGSEELREVYCFDVQSGALSWRFVASELPDAAKAAPKVTSDTGYAAATMATEGNYVFAIFATGALVALDFEGQLVWSRQLGVPDNPYGHASSLVIDGELLYVQYDQRADARILALDLRDGSTRWKVEREFGASWSTPCLFEHDGQLQLAIAAESALVSYDASSGAELWRVECLRGAEVASTPVYSDGMLYAAADYASVLAVDLATKAIAWEYEDLVPGVSTPLLVGDYLVAGLSEGGIICLDAKSGAEVWFEITDEGFYSSPVLVGENVFLLDRMGGMHIFQVGPEFSSVASTALEEEAISTPGFQGGALFIRGPQHLYRIGS
jgi:outer membrane protein assembly factor BamB